MVTEKDESSQMKLQTNDMDHHDQGKILDNNPHIQSDESVKNAGTVNGDDGNDNVDDDELSADGWLDILDNKQILKKIIHEGDKQVPRPERGCRVRINLETKLRSTKQRIDSECYQEVAIFVGDCDLFHALDLVVPLMHQHERCQVVIAPRFAFGDKGREPDIPGDSTLECEVELVSIDWVEDVDEICLPERFKIACEKKERGNYFFKRSEWSSSISAYKRAIEFLNTDTGEVTEVKDDQELLDKVVEFRAVCHNNLAQALMKIESYDQALESVNLALEINEKNSKALFRKGKILEIKGELQDAVTIWEAACQLEPDNVMFKRELEKVRRERKKQLADEKIMFRRMLELPDTKSGKSSENSKLISQRVGTRLSKWLNPKNLTMLCSIFVVLLGVSVYAYI
ncbi:peptidyl-prolyl cis-trans isomerase zonda [Brevipalpus obovatus]|uniref:peptidyl-prolyl cis-trans isomerase zonda n=1 Tax=Brevipalpus obovatus TaxID=246614 RepID=UPI003D9F194F